MAKIILGITGEIACGKGTVTAHLAKEYQAGTHRFSTMLRDVLDRMYIEQTRENLALISKVLRQNFGEDVMAKTMMKEAESDEHEIVIIDGVRRLADIKYLRELPQFKLIYIEADIQKRYERIIKRGENTDDKGKTFEEFQKEQTLESETQIRDLKNYANYVVDNNGTYTDLYAQIDKIIKESI